MGLFSTISSNGAQASSSKIPTVVQLFSDANYIRLDSTSKVSGYTTMTYQAVQVGSSAEEEVKNRHQNPDLGVWNCRVTKGAKGGDDKQALVDSLLGKALMKTTVNTFCMTVNLSEETTVEPTLTSLQGALVRHLIEHPPAPPAEPTEEEDPAAATTTTTTATTSLYQLQTTTFGLATEDKQTDQNINESYKDIMTTLMICAVLPAQIDEHSESAYQKKQAKALLIYHLRKFAAAVNCSLVFVEEELDANLPPSSNPPSPTKESQQATPAPSTSLPTKSIVGIEQPTVNYEKVAQLWRDLALGMQVWKETSSSGDAIGEEGGAADPELSVATPIYGPGRHQEDSIETVLLRNAHHPGHWEAQKDSLWVALPTPQEQAAEATGPATGDEGWLTQLRESIVSAADTPRPVQAEDTKEEEPKKDAAVSSFFESLLKNP